MNQTAVDECKFTINDFSIWCEIMIFEGPDSVLAIMCTLCTVRKNVKLICTVNSPSSRNTVVAGFDYNVRARWVVVENCIKQTLGASDSHEILVEIETYPPAKKRNAYENRSRIRKKINTGTDISQKCK